jgi:molybdopterin-guanine dinucleotide biosynthesis protein A
MLNNELNIGYVDADHKHSEGDAVDLVGAIHSGAKIDFTDKISHLQTSRAWNDNPFQIKKIFSDQDLVLVNGNHFVASRQILVIDPKKDLMKKLDRITDVSMILLKDPGMPIPDFLKTHIKNFKEVPIYSYDDTEIIAKQIKAELNAKIPEIKGLVLAGGKSTRMHQDKGLINYHGLPQREYAAELISRFCSEVFISCQPEQTGSIGSKFTALPDSFSGLGPFGGIVSAFRQDPNAAWLVVACDLPYLDKSTLDFLISRRNPSKIATSFWDSDHKFPEPLITIWEPKAYSELLYFLSLGHSCPRKVLINSDIELVDAPDIEALTNVNYPEEMKAVLDSVKNGR